MKMTSASAGPRLKIETVMHRPLIAVPGESAAAYALLKLVPVDVPTYRPPLHVVLTLDVSSSMASEDGTGRSLLDRVRDAVLEGTKRLRADDRISIVAFANGARVALSATPVAETRRVSDAFDRIPQLGIDAAGTAMHEGIRVAMEEFGDAT